MDSSRLEIIGQEIEISDEVKEYCDRKFSKLERYLSSTNKIHLNISKSHNSFSSDATIFLENKKTVHNQEIGSDVFEIIDRLVSKLDTQLKKSIEKIKMRKGKESVKDLILKEEYDVTEDTGIEGVAFVKRTSLKPMSVDEALNQIKVNHYNFLIFNNIATDRINIIYKSSKDRYGLIEPIK